MEFDSLGLLTCFILALEYKLPRHLPVRWGEDERSQLNGSCQRCISSSAPDLCCKSLRLSGCKDARFPVESKRMLEKIEMKKEEESVGQDGTSCWVRLNTKKAELRLDVTLICGQSFRWGGRRCERREKKGGARQGGGARGGEGQGGNDG
eukprot:761146-Hanusia_phi.AAC.3